MHYLELRCNVKKCNIDGSTDMLLEKCVPSNGHPCYYLSVKTEEDDGREDAWKKFDSFVDKKGGL